MVPESTRVHWPVAAWIRLKLPERPAPVQLMPGPPPPLEPPLEILRPRPVATDPRRRVFAAAREVEDGEVRLVWDSDNPEILDAELRVPQPVPRAAPEVVRRFWATVKEMIRPIGPLPVLGADPRPGDAPR